MTFTLSYIKDYMSEYPTINEAGILYYNKLRETMKWEKYTAQMMRQESKKTKSVYVSTGENTGHYETVNYYSNSEISSMIRRAEECEKLAEEHLKIMNKIENLKELLKKMENEIEIYNDTYISKFANTVENIEVSGLFSFNSDNSVLSYTEI